MMMDGFGMGFGWIFWLVLIAIVVWAVFRITGSTQGGRNSDRKDPIQILKERYAKGEIEKDEFERMKRELA
jgi:putative membrane protein